MNNSMVLIKKECVQMLRDFKIIWLPIVFICLGATQPIVTHYLPSILEALGGGQGITIDLSMAAQKGGEVLATTLGSQFDQLGLMILVISMMGAIQTDKANGILAFILTRPVTVTSYVGGKIVSNYVMVACSVTIGYVTSYLYVNFFYCRSICTPNYWITILSNLGSFYRIFHNDDKCYFSQSRYYCINFNCFPSSLQSNRRFESNNGSA